MTSNILNSVVVHPRKWEGWIAENIKLLSMSENKSCTRWSISLIHQVMSHGLPVILGSLITTTWLFSTTPIFFPEISQILRWMCLCLETLVVLRLLPMNSLVNYRELSFSFFLYVFGWKFEFSTKKGLYILCCNFLHASSSVLNNSQELINNLSQSDFNYDFSNAFTALYERQIFYFNDNSTCCWAR